jgi:hypothetical protein
MLLPVRSLRPSVRRRGDRVAHALGRFPSTSGRPGAGEGETAALGLARGQHFEERSGFTVGPPRSSLALRTSGEDTSTEPTTVDPSTRTPP